MTPAGGRVAKDMSPEERRKWVETHDRAYVQDRRLAQSYSGGQVCPMGGKDTYNEDHSEVCRIHAVDKHGWGYRRELKWGQE